jgi:hypothetical protein
LNIRSGSHLISIIATEGQPDNAFVGLNQLPYGWHLYYSGLLIFRTFTFWHQNKKLLVWLIVLATIRANLMIHRSKLKVHVDRSASHRGCQGDKRCEHPLSRSPMGSHTRALSYRVSIFANLMQGPT